MDGVSIAASIIGIATAGVQVSIKLVTLATQISTASDRVSAIGNDISLTAGVLRQLGDLMAQETKDGSVSILNPEGLETTRTAAAMCERIFSEIEKEVKRASEQLRRYKPGLGKMRGQKIELSKTEKAKWPFMQPRIDDLRGDLRDAKSTLILLLQVATLALNKRMADAPVSAREDQDLIRAVVALELDRRIKPPEVSRSPSSNNAPNLGNTNGIYNWTPPGESVLKKDQNRSLSAYGTQPGPMYDPGTTISQNDLPGKRKRDSLDATAGPRPGRPEAPRPPGIMEVPPNTFSSMPLAEDIIMNPPHHSSVSSGNLNESELQLFLLKPLVKDLHDRIELRWIVQDTNTQPLAIREYLDKNEKDEIPSVVEMLEQLHAYEQELVESETPKDSGRSILSLKRTRIDIRSRDMLFKSVPGLKFVVQCRVRQSLPQGEGPFRQTIHRVSGLVDLLRRRVSGRRVSGHLNSLRPTSGEGAQMFEASSGGPQHATFGPSPSFPSAMGFDRKMAGVPQIQSSSFGAKADSEEVDTEEIEVREDDKDDADAEAMVNDLLKQYTTLFNS